MKQVIFIGLSIILSTIACSSAKETMEQTTPLYNTRWSLKKIYSDGKEEAVNTKAFIRFDKDKGSAGGKGSCNSFGSTASVNGNDISFKNIFSTKMYCEQVQQVENKYLGALDKVTRFEIKDKKLLLYNNRELILEFRAEEEKKSTE